MKFTQLIEGSIWYSEEVNGVAYVIRAYTSCWEVSKMNVAETRVKIEEVLHNQRSMYLSTGDAVLVGLAVKADTQIASGNSKEPFKKAKAWILQYLNQL